MLTSTAPTLLRPGLAVASRTGSNLKPAAATAKMSAALLFRRPSPMTVVSTMPSVQSRMIVTVQRKLSPLTTSTTSPTLRRCASTSTSNRPPPRTGASVNRDAAEDAAAAAAIAAKTNTSTASTSDLPPLDWNTFFALRKTRRRIQLGFSVAGGAFGGLVGGLFLGSGVAEPVLAQIPLDPFLTLGLMTFGFATLGWLAGPSVGNVVFYAWKRQYKTQMTLKETQFFARIKRNRVDPSASSAGNPVPDFYGEKISSVAGYRQWLKDQRAFNKKRTTFV
ncbi:TIM23 complex component [Sporothrix eucalyptigena]|uniref:Presequence translocated-associated motor subunit PAM17 n=1 Tax=Sporothrix eucalyptigena TaxID=1812306 RepID=A0ABP0CCJ9_9PEZI